MQTLRMQVGCVIILLFIMVNYYSAKRRSTTSHKIFSSLLGLAVVNVVLDFIFAYGVYAYMWASNIIDKPYLVTLVLFISLLFLYIFRSIENENEKFVHIHGLVFMAPAILGSLVILIAPLEHIAEGSSIYAEGLPLYTVYISLVIYLFAIIFLLIRYGRHLPKRKYIVISTAIGCLFIAFIAQLIYTQNTLTSVGITVVVSATYFIAENSDILLIEQLRLEKERANNANASKSAFIANVSHEIRTPINAILGMNEMILRESTEENIIQYSQDIANASYSLYSIINDVLDVSKIDSGKMDIVPVKYNLNQLIYDTIALNKARIDAKQLDFFVEVNPNLPSGYYGDDIRIRQVLSNLLSNAIKYTHEGFVRLTVDGDYKGDYLDLSFQIQDTGIGIKEEDISKLFEAFQRIEEERNRNIEGTGLGMNITNSLLRMMGSRLKISSAYGEGSIFSFAITQRIINPEPVGDFASFERQQNEYAEVGFKAPTVKLLVVDDNALNRRVFMSLLNGTEIRVDEATSGYECIDMAKKQQYDMIFLDHLMPVMDGMETLKMMKEDKDNLNRNTPVIMLTANSLESIKEEYNAAGFDSYLSKPIFSSDLSKMIKAYLPSHKIELNKQSGPATDENVDWKEALPQVRGINWKEAIKHLPTEDILKATLKDFHESIVSEARMLDACVADIYNDESLELFRIKIHAIKSSSAIIGAEILSEGARDLEVAAKNKDIDLIKEKYPYMINYYRSFIDRLAMFDDGIKKKRTDIDFPQVIALVKMVELEMLDMNKQNAIDALNEIELYEYNEDITNELIKLRMAVDDFDSERVGKLVSRIEEKLRILRKS